MVNVEKGEHGQSDPQVQCTVDQQRADEEIEI
jgi:hypothetical protein